MSNAETLIVQLDDGPFAGMKFSPARGTMVGDRTLDWPLPDELWFMRAPNGVVSTCLVDPGYGATRYVKASESQITDEQIAKMTHVVRGALYREEAGQS